jgi:hypothetical protein
LFRSHSGSTRTRLHHRTSKLLIGGAVAAAIMSTVAAPAGALIVSGGSTAPVAVGTESDMPHWLTWDDGETIHHAFLLANRFGNTLDYREVG